MVAKTNIPNRRKLLAINTSYRLGGCTTDHIRILLAWARSPCYSAIAELVEEGFLLSIRLPSQTGTGSGKAFLTPGRRAWPLLRKQFQADPGELRRLGDGFAPVFAQHHLAVCDFRLALELACQRSGLVQLGEWLPEHELRRSPLKVEVPQADHSQRTTVVLIADGQFTLTVGPHYGSFRFEQDMGTVAPKRLQLKLAGYLIDSKAAKVPAPVLFVVPDHSRQQAVATWTLQQAKRLGTDPTMIWITTKAAITPESVLHEPIWQVVGGPDRTPLAGRPIEAPRGEGTGRSTNGQLVFGAPGANGGTR